MLPIVLYEPRSSVRLYPVADFYPMWELRCGAFSAIERWRGMLAGREILLLPRPELLELAASFQPQHKVIFEDALPSEAIYISAALIPSPGFDALSVASNGSNPHCKRMVRGAFPELLSTGLADVEAEGEGHSFVVIREIWHIIQHLEQSLRWDSDILLASRRDEFTTPYGDGVFVHKTAKVASFVAFDSSSGTIVIDKNAELKPFSHLVGPMYIGEKTIVLGGKLSASSLGRNCRAHGEIANSVFQDFDNKAHDGFTGHSYLAPFVNLGAMTTNSNLKNTYGLIRLKTSFWSADTNMDKFGFVVGPHSKFGIGSLISTGSLLGGHSNMAAGGRFLPKHLDHFSWVEGDTTTTNRYDSAMKVAQIVASRRNETYSAAEKRRALSVYKRVYKPT